MAGEKVPIELDPRKVLQALKDMQEGAQKLADTMDDALGKDAAKSVGKLEEAAEKGSSRIAGFFRNLGQRVKEDLKSAFDAGKVLSGLGLAEAMTKGVKEVFNLERAFDRLNTRLGMTGKQFSDFKKNVGQKIAGTGQKMEDIFPGVENVAAKGGVKDAGQLSSIAEALGQARATTGENVEGLSDSIVEILKTQGKQVNAQSFKQTLDALQATRVQGSFKTAGEAGSAIQGLSPYAKQMGLGTRELGGLAATASKSGQSGQDILRQLMEQASQPGGKDKLNAIFGVDLFKGGKLNAGAIGKINTQKFGQNSQAIMEQATGLTGATGADLTRFVDSFKSGMGDFKKVVGGANETSSQFATASDNLATKVDKFKEGTVASVAEVGDGLASASNDLLKGDLKGAMGNLKEAGKTAWENKGKLGAAAGLGLGGALMAGSGLKGLLGKKGGLAEGLAEGEALKSTGVTPVYVVNASEMGSKIGSGVASLAKFGGVAAAGSLAAAGVVGAGLGYGAVKGADKLSGGGYSKTVGKPGEWLADLLGPSDKELMAKGEKQQTDKMDHDKIVSAVAKGTEQGNAKRKKEIQYTNPSAVSTSSPRGGGM